MSGWPGECHIKIMQACGLLDVVGEGVVELLLDVVGTGVVELLLDVVGAGEVELRWAAEQARMRLLNLVHILQQQSMASFSTLTSSFGVAHSKFLARRRSHGAVIDTYAFFHR
jgi:hypothetical protein